MVEYPVGTTSIYEISGAESMMPFPTPKTAATATIAIITTKIIITLKVVIATLFLTFVPFASTFLTRRFVELLL